MSIGEIEAEFQKMANEKTKAVYIKQGVTGKVFGVKLGDIRTLAKKIKSNHTLGLLLWRTLVVENQLLATLLLDVTKIAPDELDEMVRSASGIPSADWLNAYVVKAFPYNEELRVKWMKDTDFMALRAGWNLTAQRIAKNYGELNLTAILDRIEEEMKDANPLVQWTMNNTLAAIGIHHSNYRPRAIEIGEKLGVYRDYPTSKGCTSPYAPIWIREIVKRQQ